MGYVVLWSDRNYFLDSIIELKTVKVGRAAHGQLYRKNPALLRWEMAELLWIEEIQDGVQDGGRRYNFGPLWVNLPVLGLVLKSLKSVIQLAYV